MKNPVRILISVFGLIAVAALLFVAARGENAKFEVGTPEATVQSYLKAMVDRDNDLALSYFEANTKCDSSDIDRQYFSPDLTVDLIESTINGDRAQVKIRIRYSNDDLFGGWSEEHTIALIKSGADWKIAGTPWPLYECDGVKP